MANLTKPIKVVTQTQQGEITVNLNLNIKIEQDGVVSVVTSSDNKENKEEKVSWEMPDIETGQIIDFGRVK